MDFLNFPKVDFKNLSLKISPDIQTHVFRVYSNLAAMIVVSAVGCYLDLSGFVQGGFLTMLTGMACLFAFAFQDEIANPMRAKALLMGFAFSKGLSIGPLVDLVFDVNPEILFAALGSTALIFASFSLAVLYSPQRQTFYAAGLLSSCMSMLFWLSMLNMFFRTEALFSVELYLGLISFSLFVIYDTQVMIAKAEAGSKLVLKHSLDLYIDVIALFVRIVMVLLRKEKAKKREKERR